MTRNLIHYFLTLLCLVSSIKAKDCIPSLVNEDIVSQPSLDYPVTREATLTPMAKMASGWSGNGGDFHFSKDNIWNLGSGTISYCISRSSNYPLNESELTELVSESIEEWKTFFRGYNLLDKNVEFKKNRQSYVLANSKQSTFSINLIQKENCDDISDINFLFGVSNKIVDGYKKFSSSEFSYGASIRRNYNHKENRNGGYVWINNFSNSQKKIKHVLLHELGHVFGMKHDSTFVMNSNMALELESSRFEDNYFGTIESDVWVYMMIPNQKLTLSSLRGVRRSKKNEFQKNKCKRFDLAPNSTLPAVILKSSGLKKRGCHKVQLSYTKGIKKNRKFTLLLTSFPNNKKIKLAGNLKLKVDKNLDSYKPGVFTEWSNSSNKVWRRGIIERQNRSLPARGYFSYAGQRFAVQISNNKGIFVEIFLPKAGVWWSLKSSHY